MKILWLSWKDAAHPLAGGAEVVSTELRQRLVADGHQVRVITSLSANQKKYETVKGVEIYRTGNRYTVYLKAYSLYKKTMREWPDLIIDEMNTVPFFAYKYQPSVPTVLLTYQLARQVWFYQMLFPLSLIGFLIESIYLRLISNKYPLVLTESKSTKTDLMRFGFIDRKIKIFRVGMYVKPDLAYQKRKTTKRLLYLGALRPMKRTMHVVKAFERAQQDQRDLQLDIIGDYSSSYGKKVYKHAQKSAAKKAITFHGHVTNDERSELLKNASAIIITSVKEGWGLIATEAAARSVPAIAYNTDGLRDSVIDKRTGTLVPSGNIDKLSKTIKNCLEDNAKLEAMGRQALENSRQYTFENSYSDFSSHLGILLEKNRKK